MGEVVPMRTRKEVVYCAEKIFNPKFKCSSNRGLNIRIRE